MTAPVSVAAVRERARRLFQREGPGWAATGDHSAVLDVPLHPPTERAALTDLEAARAWVDSWRATERSGGIQVSWAARNWARVGSQDVPERVVLRGAGPIARMGGVAREWSVLDDRLSTLRAQAGDSEQAVAVLRSQARAVAGLDDADFTRLLEVLAWLRENPVSGRRVRELPIRGIHSKWFEVRRGLIEALHRASTGATGLGLHQPDPLLRVRFLDQSLSPGGLRDVSAPVGDLAALPLDPGRVFVFENLTTVLAMPDVPGAVVLDGGGRRVEFVARIPWAQEVVYWGDLDSHGFAILNRLRLLGVSSTSALMDSETLLAHRDQWVPDPQPNVEALGLLTPGEQATLRLLGAEGNIRLEQERIPWEYALAHLGGLPG